MMKLTSRSRGAFAFASVLAMVAGTANVASAADEPIAFGKETFKINLGYYRPNFSTTVAVGLPGSALPPGTINSEQDLGLDSNLGGARFDGYWRFADRHRLFLGYYQLNRSASKVLNKDIGPIDIPELGVNDTILAGSNVHTEAKWQVYILGYGYSFYKTDTLEIAAKVGMNIVQLGTKLSGTINLQNNPSFSGATAGSTVTAPLPAIGLSGDWAIDDSWRMRGSVGAFQIKFNNIDVNILDASVAGEYRVYRNIWAGAGYSVLNATVKKSQSDSDASLDWRTGGWQLYASMLF